MEMKIALAGNPNCGKTTLFNFLTGSNQYVGNWPGVTVEKKEGRLKGHKEVVIQDLPGIYSLSPYTLEEVVARNYLVNEKPDAILNIVDGTNIERNLYLSTQLLELDQEHSAHLEQHIADCEAELEDDAESIITNQRYTYISGVVGKAVKKNGEKGSLSLTDRIDRVVTNRVLALPIFVAVMFCIYAVAMGGYSFSVGTMGTDWANEVLFGEWVPGLFDRLLAAIGSALAWIFYPLGWAGDMAWKATVATITGLIAKEEVVNTFGVLYHYAGAELGETGQAIWPLVAADFGPIRAYSFMIFNLLCAPCFAAMGAIRREMNNAKWTWAAIGYMCGFAYVLSTITFQLGGLFTGEAGFSIWTLVALALLVGLLYLLLRKGYRPGRETPLKCGESEACHA